MAAKFTSERILLRVPHRIRAPVVADDKFIDLLCSNLIIETFRLAATFHKHLEGWSGIAPPPSSIALDIMF